MLIGGGAGRLKTDQHIDLGNRPMRDMYYTLARGVFGTELQDFGMNATGAPLRQIPELLAI
jgi:hypothetical protein